MKKILFLIHDLGQGGAEKVLVNLVNHLDRTKFDISLVALFGGGVNEPFLNPDIRFRSVFPGMIPANTRWMKLFSPKQLHRMWIGDGYDLEVSFLEGPSARIVSGCPDKDTKLISWIHVEQHTMEKAAASFRNPKEAADCYRRFDKIICVSQFVEDDFCRLLGMREKCEVLHNVIETDRILRDAGETAAELQDDSAFRLIAVGSLKQSKGYMRLLRIVKRLKEENYKVHLYILGIGPLQKEMESFIRNNALQDFVTLLGYRTNPYKYVKNCDLFVCASFAEGFSTAATEALIVGTPVCTVEVSGMRELLGENQEFGIITENEESALFEGIKSLLDDRALLDYYAKQAALRALDFDTEKTVSAVEAMLLDCMGAE